MTGFGQAPVKGEGQPIEEFGEPVQQWKRKDAYLDLMEFLEPGETVLGIVFGEWGWGGYGEERLPEGAMGVPESLQGKLLSIEDARAMMQGWSYDCGYGAPECYATYAWTEKRVIWVTQYDGSTSLDSAPRNPVDCVPDMPGG